MISVSRFFGRAFPVEKVGDEPATASAFLSFSPFGFCVLSEGLVKFVDTVTHPVPHYPLLFSALRGPASAALFFWSRPLTLSPAADGSFH